MIAASAVSPLASGDPTADRRHGWARDLAETGRPGEAAELMEQALELVPEWAAGWFALATFREAAGDATAVAAYVHALALDPTDRCGAALRLARLGAAGGPVDGSAHVRALFDDYAPRFEAALTGALDYRGPQLLAAAIERVAPGRRFAMGLDLGCGTGLMARAIRDRVDRLAGVDLSPEMVARAHRTGLYDALAVGELVTDLAGRAAGSCDLITAADVFCYLGDLRPAFAAVARIATPGALFAFSVERAEAVGVDDRVMLGDGLRFAHPESHLDAAAAATGFGARTIEIAPLRLDRGAAVIGSIITFTKS
ncbi:methyltransferase domain-containing protein [Siculibacillus lacustris]|uniref:Methyltransferase domain-containing protein n=1 Tax=Siculibacillus lacustris TaxID=1549641 RepID=A0A4Q9VNA6_9HYPH|nr:methyltransferase domain-containing protein [Siculibacillus lacustris]TBW37156.1 methyltransferase domain-containing protein [Siculibacillus lacustris]